jgi:hypothetical protein
LSYYITVVEELKSHSYFHTEEIGRFKSSNDGKDMHLSLLSPRARLFIAAASGALLLCLVSKQCCNIVQRSDYAVVPRSLTLWAWDAPNDLSFLKNERTAVAYYAGTITLRSKAVLFRPRRKPLETAAGLSLCPVFRIENPSQVTPPEPAVGEIVKIVSAYMHDRDGVDNRLQIDYDATASERPFYLNLLKTLRQNLPSRTHITITALTSWAVDDRWLPPGVADEAIIMLFSMGNEKKILNSIGKRKLSVGDGIDTSIGISVNEPLTNDLLTRQNVIQTAQRLYVFNSVPWKRDRYLDTKRLINNTLQISSLDK